MLHKGRDTIELLPMMLAQIVATIPFRQVDALGMGR